MIQAAAIKVYVDKTRKECILCGIRHHAIIKQLKALGFEPGQGYKIIEQGFITDRGIFLDRSAALQHAKECNQPLANDHENELFSEDLWW